MRLTSPRASARPARYRCLVTLGLWILGVGAAGGCDSPGSVVESSALRLEFIPVEIEGGAALAITEIAFIPGTSEFLTLNKTNSVTHYRLDSEGDRALRLGEFVVPGVYEASDCGLLSVAFDPEFASNRLVYFASCESNKFSQITRHEFDPADYGRISTTASTVVRVGSDQAPDAWHNVGSIGFDPNGAMWALFGDKNLSASAQDLTTNLGSVLRIVPNRIEPGYLPAPGNPFVGMTGRNEEIAAYGIRSPWRGALDHAGRLWIGDVGDSAFEEVNVTRFAGENFGASIVEGPCGDQCQGLTGPVVFWDRSNENRYSREDEKVVPTTRRVVWVGIEYPRSVENDRYAGKFFDRMLVGDFCAGWIRAIELDEQDQVVYDEAAGHLVGATAWALGPDGYVYASNYGGTLAWPYSQGAVYRAVLAR
jgi:hypothetical protein